MANSRKDTITWDDETKRKAKQLADHFERTLSAEIRYRINRAWLEIFGDRQTALVDSGVEYTITDKSGRWEPTP